MSIGSLIHLEEPLLEFGYGQKLVYPRDGLFLYGPVDGGRSEINYGAIGTPAGLARLQRWTEMVSGFLAPPLPRRGARSVEPQHVAYPGFSGVFNSGWPTKPHVTIASIDPALLAKALRIENRNEAIKAAVDQYVMPLIEAAARVEDPPKFWFVVIPEEVYELGRPLSKVPVSERIPGSVRMTRAEALELEVQHTLFGIDEAEAEVYKYANHFRRQLKARLLKDKIVTQLVRETTLAPNDFLKSDGRPRRRLEDLATVAWKLTTTSYYKDGGRPWQLADVRSGVCYVGLAYKRREAVGDDRFAVCAAQMFLSSGEGVVFRGALGPWYRLDSKQFHLDEEAARSLVAMVIKEYRRQHDGEAPSELFLHAKSSFTSEEWDGFCKGAPPETNIVCVQIADLGDSIKLFRPGRYPVLRGSAVVLDDTQAFLWTAGYVPRLDTYLGPETPNPLLIRRQRGECRLETILSDILGLTKINFNTCLHNDRLPVTIRFADAVGEIMLAAPQSGEPRLPFKFYI